MKLSTWVWVLVAVILAIGAFWLFRKGCGSPKPDIIAARDSVQMYRLENGKLAAAIKQREQDYYRAEEGYLDSIAALHRTKVKFIREVVTVIQQGETVIKTIEKPVIKYDTVQGMPLIDEVSQHYISPYYDATAIIRLNGDSSELHLKTFDTLSYVAKTVKEGGLFNRREYLQVVATNSNPYNQITGLNVFRQPLPRPKKFGIGFQVGYGLGAGFKPGVVISAGVNYNFICF